MRIIALAAGALLLVVATLAIVFLVGMRTKYPPVLRAVRRMNRAVWNPRAMKTAGQPGAYASVIQHVGRTSGTPYETPIAPFPTDDGFVIALPYGTTSDWLKNVLAAGTAVIIHDGRTYQVDHPEVIPSEVALRHLPATEKRNIRMFRIDQFLQVRTAELLESPG
jgi:deazaflavin-dependent oxidoreductase (nitroreductase family)